MVINSANIFSIFSTSVGDNLFKLLIAFVALTLSATLAKLFQNAIVYILNIGHIDERCEKTVLMDIIRKSDIKNSLVELIGELTFWAVILVSLVWIIFSFQFTPAIALMRFALVYITKNVVSAIFILVLSVIFGSILAGVILFIGALVNLPGYKLIAKVNQYVVVIFGVVVSLDRLGISTALILSKLDIILGFFALAGAISFGLGCKDIAASFLANFLRGNRL